MENRAEFIKKLNNLVAIAKENGSKITIDEVKNYFGEATFTEEQMELVFDYLLTQKVVVQGYVKMPEVKEVTYTEEEQAYLDEYLEDLKAFKEEKPGEKEELFRELLKGDAKAKNRLAEIYLKEVVAIAKQMYSEDVFLGDLIQEGNMGLIVGLDTLSGEKDAHAKIISAIKQQMNLLIKESAELAGRDRKMVEKVNALDEGIKTLTEELGRKVTIEELAVYMGMSEEEIEDVLHLMGEDAEEES